MPPTDTSIEAHDVQMAVYRRMSPEDRVRAATAMSEQSFRIAADGIRLRHPEYSESDIAWALKRLRVGDELFGGAWPDAPLLDP